ncbi:L-idonate 5-dehydrogenase [Corynebacterium guangdongense]|uniref:L-idonate 5-dehydrogenase n=1 Tax=Corynebacterium guangdongense TaxID=1783348 RepID=A0ABU1ZUM6_9CORY|nr:L-idonate 5-dehydrogenase [Corynebacterium guangdongense]MDR7328490.1 L-idonate 5-dehydrogenase [Corynebacterium guangdongense]WJZ17067.1 L-idonate 5-dehydrogenase (NAD(P)(+)) [Corynebacterium guangdongense]
MKAVIISEANNLRVAEVPDPTPGPGEVRVAMEYGGICGSDIAYWKSGVSGTAVLREPLILGHEVAGRIDALGEGVEDWRIGQTVTFNPATLVGDHEVPEELADRTNLWPEVRYFGSAAFLPHEQGGFSTYRVVRAEQLRAIPEGVSTREAAAAEPAGVAFHAVSRAGDLAGKRVLVNGVGPIGLLVVAAAKFRGAGEIWAADLADSSLEIAARMGADHTVNASREELPGDFEVVFDASGAPAAIGGLLLATRRGGTLVQVGNLPGQAAQFDLGQLVTREITWIGSYRFIDEVTEALEAMAQGMDVTALLTHEFPIEQAEEAFATAADRSTGSSKVLLKLD